MPIKYQKLTQHCYSNKYDAELWCERLQNVFVICPFLHTPFHCDLQNKMTHADLFDAASASQSNHSLSFYGDTVWRTLSISCLACFVLFRFLKACSVKATSAMNPCLWSYPDPWAGLTPPLICISLAVVFFIPCCIIRLSPLHLVLGRVSGDESQASHMKGHGFERRNVSVYKDVEQVTPQNEKRSPRFKIACVRRRCAGTVGCC